MGQLGIDIFLYIFVFRFATQGGVTAHQRNVHDRVCVFMCHICPKTFPTQGTLKGHLYSHVAKSERKQCQECGKWLKSDLTLRVHMRSHSGQVFRCPHCNKAFNDKQRMRVHMRSHSSARPYKCLVCGKTFKLRSGLRVSKYMPAQLTLNVQIYMYNIHFHSSLFLLCLSLLWVLCTAIITVYGMVPIRVESVYITLYCMSDVWMFGTFYKSCSMHCINF